MPQHRNAQSFILGDARAAAAGRKGGKARRLRAKSPDWVLGYRAGARTTRRHFDRWLKERGA